MMSMKKLSIALLCCTLIFAFTACNVADMELGGLLGELLEVIDIEGPGEDLIPEPSIPLPETEYVESWWTEDTYIDVEIDTTEPWVELPTGMYAGYTLTMLGENADDLGYEEFTTFLSTYERNQQVQAQYGIQLDCICANEAEIFSLVANDVAAGTGDFDVVFANISQTGALLTQREMLLHLKALPYLDLSHSRWDADVNRGLGIGNYLPMATGELVPTSDLKTALMVFNENVANKINVDLYDYVKTGGWTIEKMYAIVNECYGDMNGNGKTDIEDSFGLVAENTFANAIMVSTDTAMVIKDEDNLPFVYNAATDQMTHMYSVLYEMIQSPATTYYSKTDMPVYPDPAFTVYENGYTLLYATDVEGARNAFNRSVLVSIIPYPKFDVEQEEYKSFVSDNSTAVMVPTAIKDPELVGYALEALAQASNFRGALSASFCSTSMDQEMLELIWGSKTLDFGCNYVTSGQTEYVEYCLEIETASVASRVKANVTKIRQLIRELTDIVENQESIEG